MQDRKTLLALLLVLAGGIWILFKRIGLSNFMPTMHWTAYIIAPGAMILALAAANRRSSRFLASLGAVIVTTGLLLAYQHWADHFQGWAYAGIITGPMAVSLGWLFYGAVHQDAQFVKDGRALALGSAIALILSLAFFGLFLNIRGFAMLVSLPWSSVAPLALIACGLLLTQRAVLRVGPSDDGERS